MTITGFIRFLWRVRSTDGPSQLWKFSMIQTGALHFISAQTISPQIAETIRNAQVRNAELEMEISGTYPNSTATSARSLEPLDDDFIPFI